MKVFKYLLIISLFCPLSAFAENYFLGGLTIKQIRSVGDYQGSTFDSTIELWFTVPLAWPSESGCTANYRVFVDSTHNHIVSAAYMAFASDKKVNINIDNSLPKRSGACEVSFLDVLNN